MAITARTSYRLVRAGVKVWIEVESLTSSMVEEESSGGNDLRLPTPVGLFWTLSIREGNRDGMWGKARYQEDIIVKRIGKEPAC